MGTRDGLFALSQKGGKWPNLFAIIVANAKIVLDSTALRFDNKIVSMKLVNGLKKIRNIYFSFE